MFEVDPVTGVMLKQERMLARMYVSKIQDRFGNTLTFTYDGDKLTAISGSDGRSVAIAWRTDAPLIDRITVQPGTSPGRIWRYEYLNPGADDATLGAVVVPDGTRWTFALAGLGGTPMTHADLNKCGTRTLSGSGTPVTSRLTAPTGLTGTFTVTPLWHARNYVPSTCLAEGNTGRTHEGTPPVFGNAALTSKQFSGPGMATRTWTYAYAPAAGSTTSDPCASAGTCPASTWVDVTDPGGNRTRHTYSNRWNETEGKLLRTDAYQGTSTLLRTTTYTYAPSTQGPWPSVLGDLMLGGRSNEAPRTTWTPLDRRTIIQQGVTFAHDVTATGFDASAREISAVDSNTQGTARSVKTTWHDNQSDWVLGQVAKRVLGTVEVERTEFDTLDRPYKLYSYGKLKQTLSYYGGTDPQLKGALYKAIDGRGNGTTLSRWYRGVPRTITYSDGHSQSVVVNAHGWITAVTDEGGEKTCYGYNAMGRITSITYPSRITPGTCDSSWNPTTVAFAQVAGAEYGVPAGHWRQTISTGNARKITYFDGLWRPVLVREYDAANVAATERFNATSYAATGQLDYSAYPMSNAPGMEDGYWTLGGDPVPTTGTMSTMGTIDPEHCYPWPACESDPPPPPPPPSSTLSGVHTTFDALGRVTTVVQDSELGPLTATTEYLGGFSTRATNPRLKSTTTNYLAWGEPTTEYPVAIQHPDGVFTDLQRNGTLGTLTAIKRRNSTGGLSVTRSYSYNGFQELCKTEEPETHATLMGYDAAGNLAWSAAGLPSGTACSTAGNEATILPRKTVRTYDARNRPTSLAFADHSGDTTYAYTPTGLLDTIAADNGNGDLVTTVYGYDNRGHLLQERMLWGTRDWPISYEYEANGHLAELTIGGIVVPYVPNALGQPTRVSGYATGISYYPNGAVKQFTYGNGIVHTLAQNLRGLPDRSTDAYGTSKILDDAYDYDANGNVAAITDGASTTQRGNRTMTYDDLDRLTDVVSPMYGAGGAHYSYDVLDNLVHVVSPAGINSPATDHYYCYTANQLTNVKTGSCAGATVSGLDYDLQGNLKTRDAVDYAFDFGNRLRTATNGITGATSTYVYDGHGRRVRDTTNGGGRYSLYSQAGQLLYAVNERAHERYWYIYLGNSLVATRQQDTSTQAVSYEYQHTDALGSPVAISSASRVVFEKREYAPYGRQLTPVLADGPDYTGHVADAATGLIYMQQRYYDPGIGRFLSVDPVTANSHGGGFNRYWYANNNPYRFTDPDGRQPDCNPPSSCAPTEVKNEVISQITSGNGQGSNSVGDAVRGEVMKDLTDPVKLGAAAKQVSQETIDVAKDGAASVLKVSKDLAVCAATCAAEEFIGDTPVEVAVTVHEEAVLKAVEKGFEDRGNRIGSTATRSISRGLNILDAAKSLVCTVHCAEDQ